MKLIKISDEVHARLIKDKERFSTTIGYTFTLSHTIREYTKILDQNDESKKGDIRK